MRSRRVRVINLPMCVSGSAASKSLWEYQSRGGVHINLCACECVGVRAFACMMANEITPLAKQLGVLCICV